MAEFEIKDGVAIIPEGTTAIDYEEFKDCTELKTIYVSAKKADYYKQRLSEELW